MRKHIALILFILLPLPMWGKTEKNKQLLSPEQQQQFTYYWYASRQAIEENRHADAYALLRFCYSINPNDAQIVHSLGVIYYTLGNQEQALTYFKKAYELASKDYWQRYLELMKELYISEQNWKQALKIQEEIDSYNGYNAFSAVTRYRIYAMWNKPKQALKTIDKYLETDPYNLRFLLFRIDVMEQIGAKPKDMCNAYERALAMDEYNLTILNNYAYYLATHGGDLDKAERMSAMTIKEEPNYPTFLDTYGWIMHLKGQDELAFFYLDRAWRNASDTTKKEIEKHIQDVKK